MRTLSCTILGIVNEEALRFCGNAPWESVFHGTRGTYISGKGTQQFMHTKVLGQKSWGNKEEDAAENKDS